MNWVRIHPHEESSHFSLSLIYSPSCSSPSSPSLAQWTLTTAPCICELVLPSFGMHADWADFRGGRAGSISSARNFFNFRIDIFYGTETSPRCPRMIRRPSPTPIFPFALPSVPNLSKGKVFAKLRCTCSPEPNRRAITGCFVSTVFSGDFTNPIPRRSAF